MTSEPQTLEATLAEGRYCYTIENNAAPLDTEVTSSPGPAQFVAVRMLLTPP